MPTLHVATGIILKRLSSKESDKTVVLFSQEFGKLLLVAKGAQKVAGRRIASLDSLNLVTINFSERVGRNYIREVDVVSRLQTIKDSYEKRRLLILFAEVLDKLLPLNQCEDEIYSASISFVKKLGKGTIDTQSIVHEIYKLLQLFGYSYSTTHTTVTLAELKELLERVTEREIKSWRLS